MDEETRHLELAERHIHDGIRRIREQQARVRSGRGNVAVGINLLDTMYEALRAGLEHRRAILRRIRANETACAEAAALEAASTQAPPRALQGDAPRQPALPVTALSCKT